MKVFHRNFVRQPSRALQSERGIALVVTLILLSVVTFLAVAFLFLATRERGAVATTVDMAVSRRAAEAAVENARVQVMASLISSNPFYYRMLVSTNYFNTNGFIGSAVGDPGFTSLTNVNYDYLQGGSTNFSPDQRLQNIANAYYASRPPVFVRTNRTSGKGDFRYYLDLNQNGRFDTNGLMVEIGNRGLPLFTVDSSGRRIPLTNFYVGDPEWIGILERPDRPHSASNKYVARWCFIAVPSGKTLDINTLHNQAKQAVGPLPFTQDGFIRNMGGGPWEMNLASFLVDLNTNVWNQNAGGPGSLPIAYINPTPYVYRTALGTSSDGTAFDDAVALTRYRYGGNWNNLRSVSEIFGPRGIVGFENDGLDGYGSGPLLLTNTTPYFDGDVGRTTRKWAGAENPNHFFSIQDLLDGKKTIGALPTSFSDRLANAGYFANSFYDRYTFYRLLSQLGTDSPPDPTLTNKVNLNYINVDTNGLVVSDYQTNFFGWSDPLQFFTNSADRLLRATFNDTKFNLTNFGIDTVLNITNIPVLISNQMVYSPSVHRLLQVTANIWDSSTNRIVPRGGNTYPFLPSVFRPVFRKAPNKFNPSIMDIYINGYKEVGALVNGTSDPQLSVPLNLAVAADRDKVVNGADNLNIYGVPWVIGAKKGFPNFNEFASESIVSISRKLQLRKTVQGAKPYTTNQLFVVGISNTFAFEAWNSYRANYSRDVQIAVANDMSIGLTYTNDVLDPRNGTPLGMSGYVTTNPVLSIPATAWNGFGNPASLSSKKSFIVPLQTNIMLLNDAYYRSEPPSFVQANSNSTDGLYLGFEQTGKFPIPQFHLAISNHIRFIMLDTKTQRIVDYVQLDDLNSSRNLTSEIIDNASTTSIDGTLTGGRETLFWLTNRPAGNNSVVHPSQGVINQIEASLGNIKVRDWRSIGLGAAPTTMDNEIRGFAAYMLSDLSNTNLTVQAPFTPSRKTSVTVTWQANDPLVHYLASDLRDPKPPEVTHEDPGPKALQAPLKNISQLNKRFDPWGGNPSSSSSESSTPPNGIDKYDVAGKDPGISGSDDWEFPTNKYATLGMVGRVHRGTPWQTVYLKAADVTPDQWRLWSGNTNSLDGPMSRPVMDHTLLDVFTTAINKDSTRGQLNVNQDGIAAWSALLGGVIGITNSSTDDELNAHPPLIKLEAKIIDPAGATPDPTNSILGRIYDAVNRTRTNAPFYGSFKHLGDILAVPELTTASPLLNTNGTPNDPRLRLRESISDAVYERLPQQLLGLMRGGDQPSFTIYAFGQALHPANRSIVTTSGPYFGLCTNYQITAEFATRSVVRVEGVPANPKAVVESFNVLPAQ